MGEIVKHYYIDDDGKEKYIELPKVSIYEVLHLSDEKLIKCGYTVKEIYEAREFMKHNGNDMATDEQYELCKAVINDYLINDENIDFSKYNLKIIIRNLKSKKMLEEYQVEEVLRCLVQFINKTYRPEADYKELIYKLAMNWAYKVVYIRVNFGNIIDFT